MRLSEVVNMNIIPNTGTVRRVVVSAVNLQRISAVRRCKRQGNQVGLWIVELADFAAFIRARVVELTKRDVAQGVGPVIGFKSILEEQLAGAVRIDRLARSVLPDRNVGGRTVRRTGRRENKMPNTRVHRGVEQDESRFDIVRKIFSGILDRLPNISMRGKVQHRIDTRQHPPQRRPIANISNHQLKALGEETMAGREIVIDDRLVAMPPQRPRRMTTDIPRTAGDKNSHG